MKAPARRRFARDRQTPVRPKCFTAPLEGERQAAWSAAGKIGAMPSTARPSFPSVPSPTLLRHRATRLALSTLLVLASSAGAALAAGPTVASPAPGKAGPSTATRATAAAATKAGPAAKTAAAKGKRATPRQQLKSEAESLALATATVATITEAQLDVALRVLTGQADCEFNEQVTVSPMADQPGHFLVGHKGLRYTMVPEETATGAVRLVDRRAGVVWLQIPVKSMLMNSKQGRRMVDACTHAEQRVAVTAVAEAGAGLGIVPTAAAAAIAATALAEPLAPVVPVVPVVQAVQAVPVAPDAPVAPIAPMAPSAAGITVADVAAAPASAPR